ncbi:MAG: hypothetical protein R3286_06925 [Gammaproteobacteria bacterium]|nr:hypothetical protein [Gammaproteobacteria bacterium]
MIAPARFADVACATALVVLVLVTLVICGAPIYTEDFWWHLAAGEMYATEGPWPERDWLLFTARPEAPIQHEWLFGVGIYLLEDLIGFQGMRVAHVVLVGANIWLAGSLLARKSAWPAGACLGLCVFIVLSWNRLYQLRPDLLSIFFTMLSYRLLLESREPPSRARVIAFAVLIAVWVNFHSLFMLSLNLVVAAILGVLLAAVAARLVVRRAPAGGVDFERSRRALLALGAALVLGLAAALVNPRGIDAHLMFLASSEHAAIWNVPDEWSHFNPWRWRANHEVVSFTQWLATDVVLIVFALVSLGTLARVLWLRTAAALEDFDAVGFGLALASVVAMLVSIRFLWMSLFVLLYVLGASHWMRAGRPRLEAVLACLMAPAAVALAVAFAIGYGSANLVSRFAREPAEYLQTSFRTHKFHLEGVHFLNEGELEGRLFNHYWMGGFLGYWLSPRLHTFIDSRTEHYDASLYLDYSAVTELAGREAGESFVDVLDRHGVDVFFGVGFPHWWHRVYTTTHLHRVPGWVLVSRSFRHAIYVREDERNRVNLERVARYYAERGIAFDAGRGFDPGAVIREHPGWAVAHALVPEEYPALLEQAAGADAEARRRARNTLGLIYLMAGAYAEQVELDRATAAEFPGDERPRRRLVYGLLRLDRADEALEAAAALLALDPENAESRRLAVLARRYAALLATPVALEREVDLRVKLNELLWRAEPVSAIEAWSLEQGTRTETLPLARAR